MDYYSGAYVPSRVSCLPATDTCAVRSTLSDMIAIVRKYRSDATTGGCARQILITHGVKDVRTQEPLCVALLQHFVRDSIVYCPDPTDVEMLQTPPRTLEIGTGDCDDKAILLATLLQSIGFRELRFAAVGGSGPEWCSEEPWDAECPPPYSHVLLQLRRGRSWLWLETIVPGAEPGWAPKGIEVMMAWHI